MFKLLLMGSLTFVRCKIFKSQECKR